MNPLWQHCSVILITVSAFGNFEKRMATVNLFKRDRNWAVCLECEVVVFGFLGRV